MKRNYDKSLLLEIRENEYVESIKGVDVLMKPIPDDNRINIIDPRVLETMKKKKAMLKSRTKDGFLLSKERNRLDIISYDLSETNIDIKERLIDVGDHKIDVYICSPETKDKKLPVLIYLHGGGYYCGDMRKYVNQMKLIAEKAQAVVIFPEYRLTPEASYPAAQEDCLGTIKWVEENAEELNIDPNCLTIAGDSAGGALVNACVLRDKDKNIKKVIEIYPVADCSDYRDQKLYSWTYDDFPVIDDHKEYAYGRIDRIKETAYIKEKDNIYIQGKTNYQNPDVSIIFALDDKLKEFPETIIIASEYDYLRTGSDYFVKRLSDLKVKVKSIRYLGCDHGFFDMLGLVVQAEELCLLIAREISCKL